MEREAMRGWGKAALAAALCMGACAASAQGAPVQEGAELQARVVATAEPDWARAAGPSGVVEFAPARAVKRGEALSIVTFLTGTGAGAGEAPFARCDIKLVDPKGRVAFDKKGLDCFARAREGDPRDFHGRRSAFKFVGSAKDPAGIWVYGVKAVDWMTGQSTQAAVAFALKD